MLLIHREADENVGELIFVYRVSPENFKEKHADSRYKGAFSFDKLSSPF
ncbi:hypothetical protein LMJ53_14330 [Rheinheimera sp. UJ51]|nr:hypothetical protein [Rheinheimera sp. UJ51]MCC5452901.1 hypothetical protein [Rheinheimera sp. UJ51]